MSAFILSDYHLSLLGRAASAIGLPNPLTDFDEDMAKTMTRILYAENARSVRYRYPQDMLPLTWEVVFDVRALQEPLHTAQILKACSCYVYQSCETDDYHTTEAAGIIRRIFAAFLPPGYDDARQVPGYEEADWVL